jgi:hypothetical protein
LSFSEVTTFVATLWCRQRNYVWLVFGDELALERDSGGRHEIRRIPIPPCRKA